MFKKFQGLYEKAEALYAMGEFELALVFFHRGKKIRSDVREFQLGINKAQEAIDNCVGGESGGLASKFLDPQVGHIRSVGIKDAPQP